MLILTSLVPAEYTNRETFFLNKNGEVTPLIEQVRKHYLSIVIDGSTDDGRKQIKKLGAELNKVKAYIDNCGKEVTDILKAKPKLIDAGRKLIKDSLDEAYDIIMKPVKDYEAEQARIKAEEQAKADEALRLEREELARLREEMARKEREESIRLESETKAKREAENRAKEAELALQQERDRHERELQQRKAEEQKKLDEDARRIANENHRNAVKNEAWESLCNSGIDGEIAKNIIILIDNEKIKHLKIIY